MAAAEQVQEQARAADQTGGLDLSEPTAAQCPQCGAATDGGRFCPECGASLAARTTCRACKAQIAAGAKFCRQCGAKVH
jgi:ribosomal protein L32